MSKERPPTIELKDSNGNWREYGAGRALRDPNGEYEDRDGHRYSSPGSEVLPPGHGDLSEPGTGSKAPSPPGSSSRPHPGPETPWGRFCSRLCLFVGAPVLVVFVINFLMLEFYEKPGRQLPRTVEGTAVWVSSHIEHAVDFWKGKPNVSGNTRKVSGERRHLNMGDEDSLFLKGLEYARGDGINPSSRIQGELLLKKLARQGNEDARAILGCIYGEGDGIPMNWESAVADLRKAAERGNAYAQFHLGICYLYGLGVRVDEKKAERYFLRSAEQGFPQAINKLNK